MVALYGTPTPYGGLYKINIASDQRNRKVCREQAELLGVEKVSVAREVDKVGVATEVKRNLGGNWRSRI